MKPIVTLWLLLCSLLAYSQTELSPDKTYTPSNPDYTVLSAENGAVYGNNGNSFLLETRKFQSYAELRAFVRPSTGLFYYQVWFEDRIEFWKIDYVDKTTPDNNSTTLIGVGNIRYKRFLSSLTNPQASTFLGIWNPVTNSPALTSVPAPSGTYYLITEPAVRKGIAQNDSTFALGDQLISNGSGWYRIRSNLADGIVSEGKIAAGAVSLSKLSSDLQKTISEIPNRWLTWVSPSPITWNLSPSTGAITLPAGNNGFWASNKAYYSKDLSPGNASVSAAVVIPTSGAADGINYFFADLVSKQYYVVNFRNLNTVPDGSYLIATWFGQDINTISYSDAKNYTKTEVNTLLAAKAPNSAKFGFIMPYSGRLVINSSTRKVSTTGRLFVIVNGTHYDVTNAQVETDWNNTQGIIGLNYVLFNTTTRLFSVVQFDKVSSYPNTENILLGWVGSWPGSVVKATINGHYSLDNVNYPEETQQASKNQAGKVQLASDDERLLGVDSTKAITPNLLANAAVELSPLRWAYTSDLDINFTSKAITINRAGFWAYNGNFLKANLNKSTEPSPADHVVVPMPANMTGINYFYANIKTKQFYIVNYTQLSTIPKGSHLIATWYNADGSNLSYYNNKANKATTLAGYGISNAYMKTEVDLLNQSTPIEFIGASRVNFDFTARTITIPEGWWVYRKTYTRNLGNIVVDMPTAASSAGINALFVKFITANAPTYYCANYLQFASVPDDAICIAKWWNATGQNLTFMNNKVNASEVYLKSETYAKTETYTKAEVDAKVSSGTIPVFSETKQRLLVPGKMYFVDNYELPIYKSSIISDVNANLNLFKTAIVEINNAVEATPKYRYFIEDVRLKSNELLTNSFTLGATQTGTNKNYMAPVSVVKTTQAAITGKSLKLLLIGDSQTNRAIGYQVKKVLTSWGVTSTMVGTMTNQSSILGEGREGWTYSNFIGKDNLHINGTRIERAATGATSTTLYQNPFLKLATDTDKTNYPDWCFRNTGANVELSYATDTSKTGDFYIFDFAYYISSAGIQVPDQVTIALSTNDLNTDTKATALANCNLSLEIMVKQIKAAYPAIKIGIIPTASWGINQNAKWTDAVSEWIEQCKTKVNSLKTTYTGLELVGVYAHINRDFSFPYATPVALSATNDTQVSTLSDGIHWNSQGRVEYANALAAYIATQLP